MTGLSTDETYNQRSMIRPENYTHLSAFIHDVHGLEPVQEVSLEELMELVVILELHMTFPTVIHPV